MDKNGAQEEHGSDLAVGAHVKCLFDDNWYRGHIDEVTTESGEEPCFSIRFEDGDYR